MKTNQIPYRILIIDDNPQIHADFKKILLEPPIQKGLAQEEDILFGQTSVSLSLSYHIDSAYQGEEALNLVKKVLEIGQHYAIAFVDIRMPPGWDGVETISRIWKADPDIQIVICTAFSDYSWEKIYEKFGQTDRLLILKKPFDNIEVRQIASTLMKKWILAEQVKAHVRSLQEMVADRTIKLTNSLSLLRATFDATADGIIVTNIQDEIIDYNNKFLQLWDISSDTLKSQKFSNLIVFMVKKLKQPEIFLYRIQETYRDLEGETLDILSFQDRRIYECYSHPQKIESTTVGRVWSFRDITERKNLENKLSHQATHDVLTGLANRALFMSNATKMIKRAKKRNTMCTIFFFDIDHFKLINDSLGHAIGDRLLVAVGSRLKHCTKSTDTVARFGGDEFGVIIQIISKEDIHKIIKRYYLALKRPFLIDGHSIKITISTGISVYPKDGTTAEVLLKNSDASMYRAKEMGRNNYQFYSPGINSQASDRFEIANDLNDALKNNEFVINYQPLISYQDDKIKIIGVEALIRWNHPRRGLLMPVEFIPIAEESGIIVSIGEWVLHTACQQLKDWHKKGFDKIWLSVNISPRQIKQKNFVETVAKILNKMELPPQYLCLEITESLLLDNISKLQKSFSKLKELGVILAIDDFGVGYSNLNYISKFPFNRLKIDKSFLLDVISNPNDAGVVLAILSIARGLGMQVLAEGVETVEQLKFLRKYHCQEFQGFLFSKALNKDDIEKILEHPQDLSKF